MNGNTKFSRIFLFFSPKYPSELENNGTRREVKGKCALIIFTDKTRRPTSKNWNISVSKTFVSKSFSNFLFCKSRLQRNLIKLESCSVPDSVFWNFWLKNWTNLLDRVIPTTILHSSYKAYFCSRGSPTIFYIFIQFDLIKYLVEVSVCTSACRKKTSTDDHK